MIFPAPKLTDIPIKCREINRPAERIGEVRNPESGNNEHPRRDDLDSEPRERRQAKCVVEKSCRCQQSRAREQAEHFFRQRHENKHRRHKTDENRQSAEIRNRRAFQAVSFRIIEQAPSGEKTQREKCEENGENESKNERKKIHTKILANFTRREFD